jgi:hypothetical protein
MGTLGCAAANQPGPRERPCALAPDTVMHIADVRALAGEYRLTRVVPRKMHPGDVVTSRLWLWPTSARDTTSQPVFRRIDHDTLKFPLYGTIQPLDKRDREDDLRASIDPIFPPILIVASKGVPEMLYGTANNRRDGGLALDGGGSSYSITSLDPNGFRGRFNAYGIIVEPEGHYCAVRVRSALR